MSFFILSAVFACKDKRQEYINEKRMLYKKYSISRVGNQEYANVLRAANDSLKSWTDKHLRSYAIYEENGWHLDDLICFNEKMDRCIVALSYQLRNSSDHDGMERLYGVKIKGKWYFLRGGNFIYLGNFMLAEIL